MRGYNPELFSKENEVGTVVPQDERQVPEIDKKNDKNDEKWGDFESPRNLADKKTARWIKEQNEFLGKQKEREFWENWKVRDPSVLSQVALLRFYKSKWLTFVPSMNKYLHT